MSRQYLSMLGQYTVGRLENVDIARFFKGLSVGVLYFVQQFYSRIIKTGIRRRVGIYSRLSVFIKGSVVIMQPIKNYLFDINGNRVIVFRSEDDAITLNNPFISIKVVNINNKVFIHDRENKFIHFNNHYDAEVISLEYKDDTVFSMKTLSEEEFESFNAANIKQEIKKIIALNNIEKQVLLELLQQGVYLDDNMIVSKAKDQITFHARKDVSSDWQVSFDSKLNTLFMDNQHKNFKVEIEL